MKTGMCSLFFTLNRLKLRKFSKVRNAFFKNLSDLPQEPPPTREVPKLVGNESNNHRKNPPADSSHWKPHLNRLPVMAKHPFDNRRKGGGTRSALGVERS